MSMMSLELTTLNVFFSFSKNKTMPVHLSPRFPLEGLLNLRQRRPRIRTSIVAWLAKQDGGLLAARRYPLERNFKRKRVSIIAEIPAPLFCSGFTINRSNSSWSRRQKSLVGIFTRYFAIIKILLYPNLI